MKNKRLNKKIAYLEFENDQLHAEIAYVDRLLRMIGFSEGLETIKLAAREILTQNQETEDADHKNEQSL